MKPSKMGVDGHSPWSQVNWGMVATWVTLLSTILFNVQFQCIYRNMQQGPLFNTLLTEYSDPSILDSLDMLEDFQRGAVKGVGNSDPDGLQYAYDFMELKHMNHPKGKEIDHARRRLISWYSKVRLFFEFDLLAGQYLGVVPGASRTQFFISVVEPLDTLTRLLDRRQPNPVFAFFRDQYALGARQYSIDWDRVPASLAFKRNETSDDEYLRTLSRNEY